MLPTEDKQPKGRSLESSGERGLHSLCEPWPAQGPGTPSLTLCPRPQKVLGVSVLPGEQGLEAVGCRLAL